MMSLDSLDDLVTDRFGKVTLSKKVAHCFRLSNGINLCLDFLLEFQGPPAPVLNALA
jgi:hypothetical protein